MINLVIDMMGGDNGFKATSEAVKEFLKDNDYTCLTLVGNKEYVDTFKDYKNVSYYQMRGEQFLKTTDEKYDFAFIDTVKREYSAIWQLLRPRLNEKACVIFDDILIYGYVMCQECETPYKYQSNRREVLNFINEIFDDETLNAQIIPVNGGLLSISLK